MKMKKVLFSFEVVKLVVCCLLLVCPSFSFSQNYQWQWAHRGGGNQNAGTSSTYQITLEQIFDVKVDQYNNYYYAGSVTNFNPQFMGNSITKYGTTNIDSDVYIVSTDCEGNFRWQTTLGGHNNEAYVSMALDTLGGLYISFAATNSYRVNNPVTPPHYAPGVALGFGSDNTPNPNNRRMALVKYDTDGNYLWHFMPQDENVTLVNTPGFYSASGTAYSLIVEPDGNIHWHCRFSAGHHLNGALIVPDGETAYHAVLKFNPQGNYIGHFTLPFTGGGAPNNVKLHRDPLNGRYYFYFSTAAGAVTWEGQPVEASGAIYALDAQGNELWRKVASSPTTLSATVIGVTTDEDSNVYLTGSAGNQTTNNLFASMAGYNFTQFSTSPYVIKLDAAGNLLWGTNLNPHDGTAPATNNSCQNCPGRALVVKGDEVFMAGSLLANAWGSILIPRSFGDGWVPILMRFNKHTGVPVGYHMVPDLLGISSTEELMAVALDHDGNFVVGGYARSTIFVNHPTIAPLTTNGGYSDFFIAKLGDTPCSPPMSVEDVPKSKLILYPNPTRDVLYVEGTSLSSYAVYNVLGQELINGNVNGNGNINGNVNNNINNNINNNVNGNFSINLEGLSRGTYLVRLVGLDGEVVTEKVIKE